MRNLLRKTLTKFGLSKGKNTEKPKKDHTKEKMEMCCKSIDAGVCIKRCEICAWNPKGGFQ